VDPYVVDVENHLNKGAVALKKARLDHEPKQLSQKYVAGLCGVEQPTVARWESAVWKPNAKARGLLFEHFDIPWSSWDEPMA
jgi:transcriptional regulator with XRE-family HTH domain